MTLAFMELAFNVLFGTIILVDLILIAMIQLGYQIKVGNNQIIGGAETRRVIATIFGYEITIGARARSQYIKAR